MSSPIRQPSFLAVPPRIAKDQLAYTVIVSNPVQMPCEARGIPAPEITWRKEGQEIDNNNLQSGLVFLPNGALRINSVRVEDAGIYECVASSEAGNDTKLIQLMVQGKEAAGLMMGYIGNKMVSFLYCLAVISCKISILGQGFWYFVAWTNWPTILQTFSNAFPPMKN